jgi:phospholipid/cholesterol/gamma-HCH transport system substrate-binding protein
MKNSLETKLGIFVVLAIFAALFVSEMVGGLDLFKGGTRVSAQFANIQDLKVGDAVKMGGVPIGRVDKIQIVPQITTLQTNLADKAASSSTNRVSFTNSIVRVTMRLNKGTAVKTDAIAVVRFVGLMGQNYVAIDFGSPGAGLADDNFPLNSAEQADLNSLMSKLDTAAEGVKKLTEGIAGNEFQDLAAVVTHFFRTNNANLNISIDNMARISSEIASGQGTIGQLIYSNTLHDAALSTLTNLQAAAADMQSTIADAKNILNDVNAGKGTLGKLVKDETLYNETTGAMTNLHQILLKVNSGQGTIGKLVNDQEFYRNAKLSLQKLDKAAEGLEDSGPLSVMGTMANSLF